MGKRGKTPNPLAPQTQELTGRTSVQVGDKDWVSITSSSDGAKLAMVSREGSVLTSKDSGTTWSEDTLPLEWKAITSSSDGNKLAAVSWDLGIWTSSNLSATWIKVVNESATAYPRWTSISSSSDGKTLAATSVTDGGGGGNIWIFFDILDRGHLNRKYETMDKHHLVERRF